MIDDGYEIVRLYKIGVKSQCEAINENENENGLSACRSRSGPVCVASNTTRALWNP